MSATTRCIALVSVIIIAAFVFGTPAIGQEGSPPPIGFFGSYKTVFTPDARSYWFKLDGKNIYENPQGPNGLGQTVAMWLVDRNTIFRERATKSVIDERVLYRVSPDGKTLTWTPFNAEGDNGQMVWERVTLP